MLDPSDSVGIVDSYFPDAHFFTEFERFDRHVHKLSRSTREERVGFVSICSPNYLHDSHMRFALRSGAHAICEKPLVLNPWNIDALEQIEHETDRKVNSILQLRVHPTVLILRDEILKSDKHTKYDVDLTYVTSRGRWYLQSWKGDAAKSGGIATNIGVHFFDMLYFLFGNVQSSQIYLSSAIKAGGFLEFERARVRWYLSLDVTDVPAAARDAGARTYRSITVDGRDLEFSDGFADLHTRSYEEILAGRGFGLKDNRPAIEVVASIRSAEPTRAPADAHPLIRKSQ